MRKIREVLRLRFVHGRPHEDIARSCAISKGAVSSYLNRAEGARVTWEVAEGLSDPELEHRLFPGPPKTRAEKHTPVDFERVHREMTKTGVTLLQLWLEYRDGVHESTRPYQYSQFCQHYRAWTKTLSLTMRQVHRAGEKAFIDYSGKRPSIIDRHTGEVIPVELFVMVLGASNYTFVEATRTQRVADFTGSVVRGLEYFGGTPQVLVPDQLRSAVSGPDRYDPDINPSLLELAQHYDCAVVPARPRKPRDKAKVETAVLVAQRWILACLRNRQFFSLDDLNVAIAELLEKLNDRPFQKLDGCRRSAFEQLDRPALKPLPAHRYERAQFRQAKVHVDYHVAFEDRFYSVPHPLVGQSVEVRATAFAVEIFHRGARVASHVRSHGRKGTLVTSPEHRPKSHRDYGAWPPERMITWGASIGPNVGKVVEALLNRYPHPEMGYRPFLALTRDAKKYGYARLDAACAQALAVSGTIGPRRRSILAFLSRGIDAPPIAVGAEADGVPVVHENIRGADYFNTKESSNDTR